MTEREQIRKQTRDRESEETAAPDAKQAEKQGEKLKADIDDLLDEIDGVLEVNAEEFVKSYVQKGGE